jgi:hypothetical protein
MLKNYTVRVLLILLMLAAGVATFTYRVDPYRAFHLDAVTTRSDLIHYLRTIRPYQLKQAPAQALILGSSRAARIRPEQASTEGLPGYNAALPGMTTTEALAHLQHAIHYADVQRVVITLDYTSFLQSTALFQFGFTPGRLASKTDHGWLEPSWPQVVGDWHTLLLSGTAVANAINLSRGAQRKQLVLHRDGTWEMLPSTVKFTRQQKFLRIARQYHGLSGAPVGDAHTAAFAELVRYCHEAGIDARFAIAPEHFLALVAYERAGALEAYFDWHRSLAGIVHDTAQAAAAPQPFPLIGLHFLVDAAEPIETHSATVDFVDAVHTTYSAGNRIGQTLLAPGIDTTWQLTPASVEAYLRALQQALQRYKSQNPALLKALDDRLASGDRR